VDVRPAGAFNQGHLPFALNVPAELFRKNIASPDKLAEILGSAGVSPSHEAVVISGAGLTKDAALAFVLLEKVGQKRTSVYLESMDSPETLDRLAQRGFAVTKAATVVGPRKSPQDVSIPPVAYTGNVRKGVIIADPTTAQGIFPRVFVASGASVPADAPAGQVVHVPYTSLLNADGTPKAAKEIWNILIKAGVPRHAELVLISDDPGEAAVNYFVLKLMGYPDLKVVAR
jgi:3-mercaptopyruvate sulfurtransferase SseA